MKNLKKFLEEVKPEPPESPQEDPAMKSKEKRQMQLKKMQAVRAGAGADIVASHTPEGEMVEGKGYQPEIEHSKLGDAKKKKDKERESKLPPHLQGDAIGKMKKAFASEGTDKAFEYVKKQIAAKYGKSGYVSKDNPRKPQSAADKAKARAHQAKVDKENAAERAKDPSQGRYPKG